MAWQPNAHGIKAQAPGHVNPDDRKRDRQTSPPRDHEWQDRIAGILVGFSIAAKAHMAEKVIVHRFKGFQRVPGQGHATR